MKADKKSSLSPSVDDDLRLRQAAFRQLHKIVKDEMRKPVPSQDSDLITECVHMMNEIKGGKNLSPAEIAERCKLIINQNTKTAAKTHIRYRPVLVAVCLVCALLVGSLAVCAIHPGIRDWVVEIAAMAPGTVIEENGITYINQGEPVVYDSISQCIEVNNLELYYPSVLPENTKISQIQTFSISDSTFIWFIFDPDDLGLVIELDAQLALEDPSQHEVYTTEISEFYLSYANGNAYAVSLLDNHVYTFTADTRENLITLINHLTKG